MLVPYSMDRIWRYKLRLYSFLLFLVEPEVNTHGKGITLYQRFIQRLYHRRI
jgi:hypothetical protein